MAPVRPDSCAKIEFRGKVFLIARVESNTMICKLRFIPVVLLLALAASAQVPVTAKPAQPSGAGAAPATAPAAIAPATPVVTINLCKAATSPAPSCRKIITREEFDRVLAAVAPEAGPGARRSVAAKYVQLLTAAAVAERSALDKQSLVKTKLELARLSLLAGALQDDVHNKGEPSAQELTSYYQGNPARFEQFTMRRLTIPTPAPAGYKYQGAAITARDLADKIKKRAAAGEDFMKLQSEVLGSPVSSSGGSDPTSGTVTRGGLPAEYENRVLALKPGQVSDAILEGANYVIYKMEGKKTVNFNDAKAAIAETLRSSKMQQSLQLILNSSSAEYNEAYFGPAPPAAPAARAPAANPPAK